MKIDRFKLYEADKFKLPKDSIFFEIEKRQKEIKLLESRVEALIREWFKINFENLKTKHFSIAGTYDKYIHLSYELHPFNNYSEYVFEIKSPFGSLPLDKYEIDDLMSYIEDPSTYEDRKKYNL